MVLVSIIGTSIEREDEETRSTEHRMLHTGLSISCILSYGIARYIYRGTLRYLREEVVERDSCSAPEQLIDHQERKDDSCRSAAE